MYKRLLLIFAFIPTLMWAQSTTPNIGLQIPATGSNNWYIPLNYDFSRLDLYLSGNAGIPGLLVNGNASITGTLTAGQITGTGGSVFATAASAGQYSPVYYSQNPTGTAFAGVAPFTGFAYYNGNAPPRSAGQADLAAMLLGSPNCNIGGNPYSPASGGCITNTGTINTGNANQIPVYLSPGSNLGPYNSSGFLFLNGSNVLTAPTATGINTMFNNTITNCNGSAGGHTYYDPFEGNCFNPVPGGTTDSIAYINGTNQVIGTAVSGFVFGSSSAVPRAATISDLNTLLLTGTSTVASLTATGTITAPTFVGGVAGNIQITNFGGTALDCITFNSVCASAGVGVVGLVYQPAQPGNINILFGTAGRAVISANGSGPLTQWTFDNSGTLTAPGIIISSSPGATALSNTALVSAAFNCGTSNVNCSLVHGNFTTTFAGGTAGSIGTITLPNALTSAPFTYCNATAFTSGGNVATFNIVPSGTTTTILTFNLINAAANVNGDTLTVRYNCGA